MLCLRSVVAALHIMCVAQVSLVGHSAGAHLVMMTLLARAKAAAAAAAAGSSQSKVDARLPCQLVGLAPLYLLPKAGMCSCTHMVNCVE